MRITTKRTHDQQQPWHYNLLYFIILCCKHSSSNFSYTQNWHHVYTRFGICCIRKCYYSYILEVNFPMEFVLFVDVWQQGRFNGKALIDGSFRKIYSDYLHYSLDRLCRSDLESYKTLASRKISRKFVPFPRSCELRSCNDTVIHCTYLLLCSFNIQNIWVKAEAVINCIRCSQFFVTIKRVQ